MKKLLTLLCICLCSIMIHAEIETGVCGDNLTWSYDYKLQSLTITGSGAMTDYDYRPAPWDAHSENILSVSLPDGLTSLGAHAFYGCTGLISITIPKSVTSIGNYAFENCSSLTSITIPESVTSIGKDAFNNTSWYENQPDGVVYINKVLYAYKGTMPANTSIVVKEGTISISRSAFDGYTRLTSVTIPESVTSIGDSAFSACTGLTSINIPESVTRIEDETFSGCSGLTSVTIPESVTRIGNYAFENCSSLTSITIPESVTRIGYSAFYGCSSLTSINIPESVTWISEYTFSGCSGLTSVTIPENVTSIGNSAFYGCYSLTSITIPNSVMSIEEYTFSGCTGLTSVTIPENVTSIGNSAFYGCSSLTSINIPESVTEIGDYVFSGCIGLTSVVWNAKQYANFSSAAKSPFYDSREQITSFSLGNGVEHVPAYLCYGMDKLTSVTIPNSVTNIGESAFDGCSKLSELHLGASLETIGANTFAGCLRLGNIYSYAALPPLAEESSFVNYNARLYVPCEVLGDYQLAIVFGNFKYIDCISSDGVDVPNNTVTVTPSTNDATFTWPSNNNANAYTLEITKDGVVFCTLTFNANGQLMGIAFAPSKDRNNAHAPQAAQATVNGWQFTVTGLNESSNYAYTMTVTDNSGTELQTYNGTFRTLGTTALDNVSVTDAVPVRKILRNGQVLILRCNEVYTVLGEKVE